MTRTRLFAAISLNSGDIIQLTGETQHYLSHVLRMQKNDKFIIFNGKGGEYGATILNASKKALEIKVEAFHAVNAESPLELYLAQGISRGEKMDYTLQKAVELGIKKIIPVFTARSTVHLDQERSEKRFAHWQKIIIHACQQCGRTMIPELLPLTDLSTGIATIQADDKLVLTPDHDAPGLSTLGLTKNRSILLLAGPEGGLDAKEIDWALKQHFIAAHLGPRILRTETAALAAISALQYALGDLG